MFPFFAPQGILIYFPLRGWDFVCRSDPCGEGIYQGLFIFGYRHEDEISRVSLIKESQVFSSPLSFADN